VIKLKLTLDTNVFNNEKFCNWLLQSKEEKHLPAIVYMEYLHHHLKKGNTPSMVNEFLDQMNINIAPFGKNEAIKAAKSSIKDWEFIKNTREYVIGSTAIILNTKLVTNDIKNFKWLDNIITPEEIMEIY
jgi:tRNA(fMet)-specific endonuclease VapC